MEPNPSKVQNLPTDANRTFILSCLANVNRALVNKDMDAMLQLANIAAVDGAILIESSDIHLKQIIASLERSFKLAKKSS